jgi:hypothetical protein
VLAADLPVIGEWPLAAERGVVAPAVTKGAVAAVRLAIAVELAAAVRLIIAAELPLVIAPELPLTAEGLVITLVAAEGPAIPLVVADRAVVAPVIPVGPALPVRLAASGGLTTRAERTGLPAAWRRTSPGVRPPVVGALSAASVPPAAEAAVG